VAGHPMPLEAYAPTALDYPTASICLARPIVIRTFALLQNEPDHWAQGLRRLGASFQPSSWHVRSDLWPGTAQVSVPCIGSRAR